MLEFDAAWKAEHDKIIIMLPDSLMRMLGVVRADLPALMAIEHHSQAKFLVRRADSSELEDFVLRYKGGNLTQFVKSEPEDQPNEHTSKILVGTNILPELFEKPAPSLLFIHDLQRCQRCRRVHPVFEDAARILKEDKSLADLIVARFDGNANEVPSRALEYRTYPTIYYISRANFVRLYEGPDSAEGLVDFVRRMHARDDGTVNFLLAGDGDERSPAQELADQTPEDEALDAILHEEL